MVHYFVETMLRALIDLISPILLVTVRFHIMVVFAKIVRFPSNDIVHNKIRLFQSVLVIDSFWSITPINHLRVYRH